MLLQIYRFGIEGGWSLLGQLLALYVLITFVKGWLEIQYHEDIEIVYSILKQDYISPIDEETLKKHSTPWVITYHILGILDVIIFCLSAAVFAAICTLYVN